MAYEPYDRAKAEMDAYNAGVEQQSRAELLSVIALRQRLGLLPRNIAIQFRTTSPTIEQDRRRDHERFTAAWGLPITYSGELTAEAATAYRTEREARRQSPERPKLVLL